VDTFASLLEISRTSLRIFVLPSLVWPIPPHEPLSTPLRLFPFFNDPFPGAAWMLQTVDFATDLLLHLKDEKFTFLLIKRWWRDVPLQDEGVPCSISFPFFFFPPFSFCYDFPDFYTPYSL